MRRQLFQPRATRSLTLAQLVHGLLGSVAGGIDFGTGQEPFFAVRLLFVQTPVGGSHAVILACLVAGLGLLGRTLLGCSRLVIGCLRVLFAFLVAIRQFLHFGFGARFHFEDIGALRLDVE